MTWGVELYWYVAGMPGGGRWPFRVQIWRVRHQSGGSE